MKRIAKDIYFSKTYWIEYWIQNTKCETWKLENLKTIIIINISIFIIIIIIMIINAIFLK